MANNKMLISIIIPYFGSFDLKRFELVQRMILDQIDVSVELIIASGKGASEPLTVPKVINAAVRMSKGEYVYVNDADILFKSKEYLASLQNLMIRYPMLSFKKPPMRRILLDDTPEFFRLVSLRGLYDTVEALDYSQDFIAKIDRKNRIVKVHRKFESGRIKTFIASQNDFETYMSDPNNKGLEPLYWNQDRHCGGTFVKRAFFDAVGGYCEDFISWGCWDADFQWKISEKYEMQLIPHGSEFEVIHIDHPKGYFSSEKWKHDKDVQQKRRKTGVQQCIKQDLSGY